MDGVLAFDKARDVAVTAPPLQTEEDQRGSDSFSACSAWLAPRESNPSGCRAAPGTNCRALGWGTNALTNILAVALAGSRRLSLLFSSPDLMDVQALFRRFNAKYFGGSLPNYRVTQSDLYGGGGLCRIKQREIHLSPILWGSNLRTRLLHEMAHAATNSGHGMLWQKEMRRLIRLGAPLKEELRAYLKNTDSQPQLVSAAQRLLDKFKKAFFAGVKSKEYIQRQQEASRKRRAKPE